MRAGRATIVRAAGAASLVGLLGFALLAGCSSSSDVRTRSPSEHMAHPTAHGPHCADIELARAIGMSSARSEALVRIAVLTDLTEHEQIFLIETVTVSEGVSTHKADVLVALAGNPSLTQKARERMAVRVTEADLLSVDVERISQALLP